jgi:hypothetical protein
MWTGRQGRHFFLKTLIDLKNSFPTGEGVLGFLYPGRVSFLRRVWYLEFPFFCQHNIYLPKLFHEHKKRPSPLMEGPFFKI